METDENYFRTLEPKNLNFFELISDFTTEYKVNEIEVQVLTSFARIERKVEKRLHKACKI